jgi:hypothetical protein
MINTVLNWVSSILLFPEKEAKSVCSASQKNMGYPDLPRSGTTGVWGLAPKKLTN